MLASLLLLLARLTGGLVLVAGGLAMASRKGGGLHIASGTVAQRLLIGVGGMLVPLLLVLGDATTMLLLAVATYLAHAGRRALQRETGDGVPPVDRVPALALAGLGLLLATLAILYTLEHGPLGWTAFGPGMALVLLATSRAELRRLRSPPDGAHAALAFHAGAMGAALLAFGTAFVVTFSPGSGGPGLLAWVGPAALGVPLLARWVSQVRREGREATFL